MKRSSSLSTVQRLKGFIGVFVCAAAMCAPRGQGDAVARAASVRVTFLDVAGDGEKAQNDKADDLYMRRVKRYWGSGGIGDSILIETGEKNILIDGGLWTKGRSVVLPYLKERKVKRLDTVILTHQHGDHYGGLTEVLQDVPVGEVLTNGLTHSAKAYGKFMEAVKTSDAKYLVVKGGEEFDWGGGVRARVLQVGGKGIPKDDYNNNSVVVRMSLGDVHFLFPGDMEEDEENALLSSGSELQSQILKVGHHGSSSSSTYALLKRVHPAVAVISVGEWNRFSLPHRSVIDRLESAGCTVYRTDLDGRVVVTSDGTTWAVETEKKRAAGAVARKTLSEAFYKYEGAAVRSMRARDYAAAADSFKKALGIEPRDASARSRLGYCYKKMGRREDAVEAFREALAVEPCDPYANLHLGLIYFRDDKKAALKYFEDYLKCTPTSKWSSLAEEKISYIHSTWGWDLKKQGREKEALAEFEKAIAICRDNAFPHFQLGLMYVGSDKERAKKELAKYLELEPNGTYAAAAREKLADLEGTPAR
jgi:competence protein ComEC